MFTLISDESVAEKAFLGLNGLDKGTQVQAKKQFMNSFLKSHKVTFAKIEETKLSKKINALEIVAFNYLEYIYDTLKPTFPNPLNRAEAYGECLGIFIPIINQLFSSPQFHPEKAFNDRLGNYSDYSGVLLGLTANIIGKLQDRNILDGTVMVRAIKRSYKKHEKEFNTAKKEFFAKLEAEFEHLR